MTLLDKALQRNPELLAAAAELHQSGAIPASTQIIDLDAVAENADVMARAADQHGLRVFVMTKQNGNNPFMTRVALDRGLHSVVALEARQAHQIHRYGLPLGAAGHLTNVPRHEVEPIVAMRPEFITVYTYEAAKRVSDAAGSLGIEQQLYVRVTNPVQEPGSSILGTDEGAFAVLVGGWTEASCVEGIRPILDLPNVRVAGLTQFGGIGYGAQVRAEDAMPTQALQTALRAKETLERELGLADLHVNTGGEANAVTFATLSAHGVTEVEPGLSLTGSGSFHAVEDMPEKPAQAVVAEVTHTWGEDVYTTGGVFAFVSPLYDAAPMVALAGRTLDEARERPLTYLSPDMVDAHGVFRADRAQPAVGDTAIFVHHPQAFLERGYTAAVSGIASGSPRVEGLFDCACNALDEDFRPLPLEETLQRLDRVASSYRRVEA